MQLSICTAAYVLSLQDCEYDTHIRCPYLVCLQVGKDTDAQEFLGRLDNDRDVGGMIDATSYFELEAEEYQRRGVVLTPELWMVKLMVGAIDPTYDEQVSDSGTCFGSF